LQSATSFNIATGEQVLQSSWQSQKTMQKSTAITKTSYPLTNRIFLEHDQMITLKECFHTIAVAMYGSNFEQSFAKSDFCKLEAQIIRMITAYHARESISPFSEILLEKTLDLVVPAMYPNYEQALYETRVTYNRLARLAVEAYTTLVGFNTSIQQNIENQIAAYEDHNYASAETDFNEAKNRMVEAAVTCANLAIGHDPNKAMRFYRRALALEPSHSEAQKGLKHAYLYGKTSILLS
jgi:hypothetical protein